jgi:hypothetical protein
MDLGPLTAPQARAPLFPHSGVPFAYGPAAAGAANPPGRTRLDRPFPQA